MRHAIATLVLAVLLLLAWLLLGKDGASETAERWPATADSMPIAEGRRAVAADRSPPASDREPLASNRLALPDSLEGTEADGFLRLDGDGRFVADENAIRLFDYFLSTEGEIDRDAIRRLVEAEAGRQVPEAEVRRVLKLFDEYLEYRSAAARLMGRFGRDQIGDHHEALMALQQDTFGQAATHIFDRENTLARDAIARDEIFQDGSLDAGEKRAALQALDEKLPAEVREIRARIRRPSEVSAVVAQMRQDGLDEAEVFAYRSDEFGTEAAERLAALDQERAVWNARLDRYRQERDAIVGPNLTGAVRAQAIDALREAHFSGTELLRVRVLDQIARSH